MEVGAHLNRHHLKKTVDGLGMSAAQIFVGSPRTWRRPDLPSADIQTLKDLTFPIFIHAPYILNPASANPGVRAGTIKSLQKELDNCAKIAGEGVVIHAGQAGGESTMEEAISRWQEVLKRVDLTAPIIIENTAGGKTAPGRHLGDFLKLMEALAPFGVEYCIDTCHSWTGGFGLEGLSSTLMSELGRPPRVIHMNGSQDLPGSGRDRHSNLLIGDKQTELSLEVAEAFAVPTILETPGEYFMRDVKLLKERLQ